MIETFKVPFRGLENIGASLEILVSIPSLRLRQTCRIRLGAESIFHQSLVGTHLLLQQIVIYRWKMSPVPVPNKGMSIRRHVLKKQHECVQIMVVLKQEMWGCPISENGDLWDHRKREFTIFLNTAKLLGYDML